MTAAAFRWFDPTSRGACNLGPTPILEMVELTSGTPLGGWGRRIGSWLVRGAAGTGWTLYGTASDVARAAAAQRGLLVAVEDTARSVLRGAHNRDGDELRQAFHALHLGDPTVDNPVIASLIDKGHVRVPAKSEPLTHPLLVKTNQGQWVLRSGGGDPGTEPDLEAWPAGRVGVVNPLWKGTPWWEVVGWPAHRGGRPRAG